MILSISQASCQFIIALKGVSFRIGFVISLGGWILCSCKNSQTQSKAEEEMWLSQSESVTESQSITWKKVEYLFSSYSSILYVLLSLVRIVHMCYIFKSGLIFIITLYNHKLIILSDQDSFYTKALILFMFNLQISQFELIHQIEVLQQMEHTLKKKTKPLIAIRTNNFIDSEIDKERFFSHLLQTLQTQLSHQQFNFLTSYLLFHQNSTNKRTNHQTKNPTQKRIVTLPDQRAFNICQIDPDLFHDKPSKQENMVFKKSSTQNHQIDFNCTNTPKTKTKHLLFENKRIMDLDKRLKVNYQANKNLIVYNPKLFDSDKENKAKQRYFIKTAYQNCLKRTKNKDQMRRLKTSFTQNRQPKTNKEAQLDCLNSFLNNSLKNCFKKQGSPSERLRNSQNSIPKHLLEQVILSRRYNKIDRSSNDFSDFRISPRYKECFS